jgi:hypothetical protein
MSRPCCSIVEREPVCYKFIPEMEEIENRMEKNYCLCGGIRSYTLEGYV